MAALEYTFWLNSFSDFMYDVVHGDKDTFMLGFAAAGQAHSYMQLSLPPGGAFRCAS